jgi:hypothetical protein
MLFQTTINKPFKKEDIKDSTIGTPTTFHFTLQKNSCSR